MPVTQMVQYRDKQFRLLDLRAIHPSGNKFFKLKLNVDRAREKGASAILSFGGAWSNHIHALASLGAEIGIETIGVIRGERPSRLSEMLLDAEAFGMNLHFISRGDYQRAEAPQLISKLKRRFGDFHLVPEGGSSDVGIEGAGEISRLLDDIDFTYLFLPVGTGGTLAGIANKLQANKRIFGISALKGADTLTEWVSARTRDCCRWSIDFEGHCGGYARCPDYLRDFILDFEQETGIELEPVYTGKTVLRMLQMMDSQPELNSEQTIFVHTGGMQGRRGFNF